MLHFSFVGSLSVLTGSHIFLHSKRKCAIIHPSASVPVIRLSQNVFSVTVTIQPMLLPHRTHLPLSLPLACTTDHLICQSRRGTHNQLVMTWQISFRNTNSANNDNNNHDGFAWPAQRLRQREPSIEQWYIARQGNGIRFEPWTFVSTELFKEKDVCAHHILMIVNIPTAANSD